MKTGGIVIRKDKTQAGRGFTLVELLVVTAIISFLAGLFLPVVQRVGGKARLIHCINNARQLGMAMEMYALDNEDRLPGCQHSLPQWTDGLRAYVRYDIYLCPSDPALKPQAQSPRQYSYAISDFLTPHPYGARHLNFSRKSGIPSPDQTMAFSEMSQFYLGYDHFHFADARDNGFTPERFAEQVAVVQHGRAAVYLYADSHVDRLRWEPNVQRKLTTSGSRFIHPEGKSAAEFRQDVNIPGGLPR